MRDGPVLPCLYRLDHFAVAVCCATLDHAVGCCCCANVATVHDHRYHVPVAGHFALCVLVVLGISGKSKVGYELSPLMTCQIEHRADCHFLCIRRPAV